MRPVTKGVGHFALAARLVSHQIELAAGTASANAWAGFGQKAGTRASCLVEQWGLCAYTELVLDDTHLGMHLDHVKPKSKFRGLTFDHGNLLLSAIDDISARKLTREDVFGGHARGNRYHARAFVQPLLPNCRAYFYCAIDGHMEPKLGLLTRDRRRAAYTIRVMNLNAPLLVNLRRRWLEEIDNEVDKLLGDQTALAHFASAELCPTNNRLRPFHSAVRQRFDPLGEQVIAQECAACA